MKNWKKVLSAEKVDETENKGDCPNCGASHFVNEGYRCAICGYYEM